MSVLAPGRERPVGADEDAVRPARGHRDDAVRRGEVLPRPGAEEMRVDRALRVEAEDRVGRGVDGDELMPGGEIRRGADGRAVGPTAKPVFTAMSTSSVSSSERALSCESRAVPSARSAASA